MLFIDCDGFEEIRGELYRKMIEKLISFSDAVMLVYEFQDFGDWPRADEFRAYADKMRELRALLMPYLLNTRNNGERTPENPYFKWPGTTRGYLDPTDPAESFYSGRSQTYVDTYELSGIVQDVIASADAFTDWWPLKNATDIAFFKDGECWFSTTVHEYYMSIDDHEEVFAQLLDEWGVEYTRYERRGERFKENYALR